VTTEVKKLLAGLVALVLVGFLAVHFVLLIEPAARREKLAACAGLRPSPITKSLATAGYSRFPRPVPDVTVQDVEGNMRKLSEYRGKVVFLSFWATWCPPCEAEVPDIEALQAELGRDDFVVVALASDESWETVWEFFKQGERGGTNMTLFLDPPPDDTNKLGAIARSFGVPMLPETFLIDRDGNIRYYYTNTRDWDSDLAVTCMRSLIEDGGAPNG
jgi:peroxiredoxin